MPQSQPLFACNIASQRFVLNWSNSRCLEPVTFLPNISRMLQNMLHASSQVNACMPADFPAISTDAYTIHV